MIDLDNYELKDKDLIITDKGAYLVTIWESSIYLTYTRNKESLPHYHSTLDYVKSVFWVAGKENILAIKRATSANEQALLMRCWWAYTMNNIWLDDVKPIVPEYTMAQLIGKVGHNFKIIKE